MIDGIHEDCKLWGDYMRQNPACWPEKNTAWRVFMELGAQGERMSTKIPRWRQSPTALRIHRIYRTMPEDLRRAMQVLYIQPEWNWKRRATKLGVRRSKLYQIRDNLHFYIAGRLDDSLVK